MQNLAKPRRVRHTTCNSNGETASTFAVVYRRKYVNTTRVQWTRVSQGNGIQWRSSWSGGGRGGWFVATMARLLCPGSIAPPPNHPSGLSHETLMQVPATTGVKKDDDG